MELAAKLWATWLILTLVWAMVYPLLPLYGDVKDIVQKVFIVNGCLLSVSVLIFVLAVVWGLD